MADPIRPTITIQKEACTSCGSCVETCPTDVFRFDENRKPYAAYAEDCQGCFMCEFDCPADAISITTHKWSAGKPPSEIS